MQEHSNIGRVSKAYPNVCLAYRGPIIINGLASVCPWAHAKRRNFCIWEILIGVVGVFAGGVHHYHEIGANQNDLNTKFSVLSMCRWAHHKKTDLLILDST